MSAAAAPETQSIQGGKSIPCGAAMRRMTTQPGSGFPLSLIRFTNKLSMLSLSPVGSHRSSTGKLECTRGAGSRTRPQEVPFWGNAPFTFPGGLMTEVLRDLLHAFATNIA
jgi:hypothetical protein